jgi:hypothetical protein
MYKKSLYVRGEHTVFRANGTLETIISMVPPIISRALFRVLGTCHTRKGASTVAEKAKGHADVGHQKPRKADRPARKPIGHARPLNYDLPLIRRNIEINP